MSSLYPGYISKINSNCEKQIIPLMISSKENEGYCYLAVKKLTVFLREITIVTPLEKNNILEVNQYMKSDKMPYIIYADIESLIKKK